MSAENNITVALIGLPSAEKKRLNAAFLYSKSRNTVYSAIPISHSPQILMVNADQPASLVEWYRYRNQLEADRQKNPPSVLVSKVRDFQTDHYQVRCPLIASRVISVLDQVTIKEFSSIEEQAILDETGTIPINVTGISKNETLNISSHKKYVLVVDDSLPVRIQMKQALSPYADRVDFAESGEEAFELINEHDYHIIFLDVMLPSIDGYDICRTIRLGKAKHTPVIMLTSNSAPADRLKGKLAGCDTYLIKPVKKTTFRQVVSQYLEIPAKINMASTKRV